VSTILVVPTFNERATVERVVSGALAADPRMQVLVVDDGSPDGTGELVEALARKERRVAVLHRDGKQGLGSAYRTGFAWGLERGADVLCEMDADLSHDPADLPRLLAALDEGADVAIGSRYVPGGRVEGWPRRRLWLSTGANRYVRAATGLPVRDATAGFRAYRRAVVEAIDLDTVKSEGYAFQIEMTLRAWRAGFTVVEVPITFRERTEGASKISRAIILEALWRVAAWGWQNRVAQPLRRLGNRRPVDPERR